MTGCERLQDDLDYQRRRLLDASGNLWRARKWGYKSAALREFEHWVCCALDAVWDAQEDLRHSQRKHWA